MFSAGSFLSRSVASRYRSRSKQKSPVIAIIFPKDSESVFNNSQKTFGGATVQLYNYASELAKSYDVHGLINRYDDIDPETHDKFKLDFTFRRTDYFLFKIVRFYRVLRRIKPDVIIQRGLTYMSPLLACLCRLCGIRFIFMYAHDREARGRFQRTDMLNVLYPLLLRFSHALIVQNGYQQGLIKEKYSAKTHKIRNGFKIEEADESVKQSVLWVSRLEPWKRPEVFIELAERMPERNFIMIAPRVNGFEEYAQSIYQKAEKVGNIDLHRFVHFDDIDYFFRQARVFVNTSMEEGFPNTFIQSCKHRTSIVSLCVNPDGFIDNSNVGFSCNNDKEHLFECVNRIFTDRQLAEKFAEGAYLYAKNNHNIEVNVKLLQELF